MSDNCPHGISSDLWRDLPQGPELRPDYDERTCLRCGSTFRSLASRVGWILRQHAERCRTPSPGFAGARVMDDETRRHLIHGIDFGIIVCKALEVFFAGLVVANALRLVASIIAAVQRSG